MLRALLRLRTVILAMIGARNGGGRRRRRGRCRLHGRDITVRLDRIFALALAVVAAPATPIASAAAAAAVVARGPRFHGLAQAFELERLELPADQLLDRLDVFRIARR